MTQRPEPSFLELLRQQRQARGLEELERQVAFHLRYTLLRNEHSAEPAHLLSALQRVVRDHLVDAWRQRSASSPRRVILVEQSTLPSPDLLELAEALGIGAPVRTLMESLGLERPGSDGGEPSRRSLLSVVAAQGHLAEGHTLRPSSELGAQWEVPHPELVCEVPVGGEIRPEEPRWAGALKVVLEPRDLPVPSSGPLLFQRRWVISSGPERVAGWEAAILEKYLLAACVCRDALRGVGDVRSLPEKVSIVLGDPRQTLVVVELLRVLLDERGLDWSRAWELTRSTVQGFFPTLGADELAPWPLGVVATLLPRHLELLYEINHRLLSEFEHEHARRSVSLIEEDPQGLRPYVLSVIGSGRAIVESKLVAAAMVAGQPPPDRVEVTGSLLSLSRHLEGVPEKELLDPAAAQVRRRALRGELERTLESRCGLSPSPEAMVCLWDSQGQEETALGLMLWLASRWLSEKDGLSGPPIQVVMAGVPERLTDLLGHLSLAINGDSSVAGALSFGSLEAGAVELNVIRRAADVRLQLLSERLDDIVPSILHGVVTVVSADGVVGEVLEGLVEIEDSVLDPQVARVVDLLGSGFFSPEDLERFRDLAGTIREGDLIARASALGAGMQELQARWGDPVQWEAQIASGLASLSPLLQDRGGKKLCALLRP